MCSESKKTIGQRKRSFIGLRITLEDRGGWEGAGIFGAVQWIRVRFAQTKGFGFEKRGSIGFVAEEAEHAYGKRLKAVST